MAYSSLKIVFDEHFSHPQVEFVWRQSRPALGSLQHTRPLTWSGKPDSMWIPLAVEQDYVIVSADRNDITREFTVADLKTMGARVILVGGFWDHLGRWEKAKWLVARVERIVYLASGMSGGSVGLLHKNGAMRDL